MKILNRVLALVLITAVLLTPSKIFAQDTQGGSGFSLQVTPSPMIATIEPGKQSSLELKVQNRNTVKEELKLELRSFSIDGTNGEIQISETEKPDVSEFVSFEHESFSVEAGQWHTEKVLVDTPDNAGFSYSFVILISRKNPLPSVDGVSNIEGSVAVFTLLNTNRPDAVKKLDLTSFISAKKSYEYVPAEFEMTIKNTGNTIIQPQGNVFIGRGGDEQQPLAVLDINAGDGYIIPDSSRTLKMSWNDGFPSRDSEGKLHWDWSKLNRLRIGKYTARAVVIYDDGERDIPIESFVTFWVVPWKIIVGGIVLILLLIVGLFTVFKKSFGVIGTRKKKSSSPEA